MKTLQITLILLLFSNAIIAQDCDAFYPFTEGAKAQITTYGKKEKVAAIVDYSINSISNNGNSQIAEISSIVSDKNGEELNSTTYDVACDGESVSIDFKSMYNPQMFQQFQNAETEISGTNVVLPNNLSVGQTLPNANIEIKVNMAGINMNMGVTMNNRKVIAEEAITTPAGTFDCFVIEYSSEVNMGIKQKGYAKQWIAKGVGMVKQEDYNKRGKVMSSSLLTAFSK